MDPKVRALTLDLLEKMNEHQDTQNMPLGDCVQAVVYLLAYLTETQLQPTATAKATLEAYEFARQDIRSALVVVDSGGNLPN